MIPEYHLHYSKRAKYLHLRISRNGLVVVIPSRQKIPNAYIEQFILEKEGWIKRNLQRVQPKFEEVITLPENIQLQAIDECWNVKYLPTRQTKITLLVNQNHELTLLGDIKNENMCFKKLRQWVLAEAYNHLKHHLDTLSNETGLCYDKFIIRNNSSRWGSCSRERTISLCCKLIFLPNELMRHVLLHELCHTQVMNHGKKFWRLLEVFDPNAREHAKELRIAGSFVPRWMM